MLLLIDCVPKDNEKDKETISKVLTELNMPFEKISLSELKQNSWKKHNGIIISGSPLLLTKEKEKLLPKFLFLKNITIPALGICFGHQIVGLINGAIITNGKLIKKKEQITILAKDPLFQNIQKEVMFDENHEEYITIPRNFLHLARSESYEIEAMKHPTKNVYGIGFHPERSGEQGKTLLKNFYKMCKTKL
ncbi:MAG: hypothetical protein AABW49_04755 [Nanoarchaeota archaeon]